MKNRTLLVDASFLLKRSISAAKNDYTKSFGHIGGLTGFLISLRFMIKKFAITKCVVMWDGENGGKKRYLIDTQYKANRKNKEWYNKIQLTEAQVRFEEEKEESILKNKIRIQNYLEDLFIRQIEVDEIEADDLIAQYILTHSDDEDLYLSTNDRDYCQLLDKNLTIIFSNIDEPITKFNYIMHFKIHYCNALIVKIICGDVSDNVKGIEGIKEDTLIKYFPEIALKQMTVREICEKAYKINKQRILDKKKPLKIFENLLSNFDRLRMNHKLMNLREPMLNEEAIEELKQLELPLSPDGRGHKNLLKMMTEDEFLSIYKGTFVDYVQPFYTVIMNEKQLLNEYNENNGK